MNACQCYIYKYNKCLINVTLTCVHETIVAVECSKYYILWVYIKCLVISWQKHCGGSHFFFPFNFMNIVQYDSKDLTVTQFWCSYPLRSLMYFYSWENPSYLQNCSFSKVIYQHRLSQNITQPPAVQKCLLFSPLVTSALSWYSEHTSYHPNHHHYYWWWQQQQQQQQVICQHNTNWSPESDSRDNSWTMRIPNILHTYIMIHAMCRNCNKKKVWRV